MRADELLDPEVLVAGVDDRRLGVGEHGLEPDPETTDRGQVLRLRPISDPAHPSHVTLVEQPSVVDHLEPVVEHPELQPLGLYVLGVLDELKDEVGALRIQLA